MAAALGSGRRTRTGAVLNRISPKLVAALIALLFAGGVGALATLDFDEDGGTGVALDDPTTTTTVDDGGSGSSTTVSGSGSSDGSTTTTAAGSGSATTAPTTSTTAAAGATPTTAPASGLGTGGTGEVAAGRGITAETGGELFLVPGLLAVLGGLGLRRLRDAASSDR